MAVTRTASATWRGDLLVGSGTVRAGTSAQIKDVPVSWSTRTADPDGNSSPEELLAAAHAACFSMALSGQLARRGLTAEQLQVTATVTFDKLDAGWTVISSHLEVVGSVPDVDQATFAEAAGEAKDGCPISRALKGNVELSVQATLAA